MGKDPVLEIWEVWSTPSLLFHPDSHRSGSTIYGGGSLRGIMANALDCEIVEREFELTSRYYVYFRNNPFGKSINTLIFPAMG